MVSNFNSSSREASLLVEQLLANDIWLGERSYVDDGQRRCIDEEVVWIYRPSDQIKLGNISAESPRSALSVSD